MITKEQKIISKLKEHLPFKVRPEHIILGKLREEYPQSDVNKETLLTVYNLHDLGKGGGIGCAIRPSIVTEEDDVNAFVCSITQLKLIPNQPLYNELQKYKTDRIKKLEQQNRGPSFMRIKR
jgi:hypothetical protein